MSYFTETFENLLEFKGEAELAYAKRRASEKETHIHRNYSGSGSHGAYMYRNGVNNISNKSPRKDVSNNHNDSFTPSELKGKNGSTTKSNYKRQVDYHMYLAGYGGQSKKAVQHSIDKHNRKVNKESYDPVYEDLCRMGIID